MCKTNKTEKIHYENSQLSKKCSVLFIMMMSRYYLDIISQMNHFY